MVLDIFLKGLIVGFCTANPFGPVGSRCIKRSLVENNKGGYFVGVGSSITDLFFAMIAGFGLTIISNFLVENETVITGLGGIFLILFGIKEFFAESPLEGKIATGRRDLLKETISGFSLALANPFVIISFFAVYALLGLGKIGGNFSLSAILILSTFVGSLLGFFLLNWIVINYKYRIKEKTLNNTGKFIGIILFITGLFLFFKVFVF